MTDTRRRATPSVVERTRLISTEARSSPAFTSSRTPPSSCWARTPAARAAGGEPQRIDVHGGAILATAADDGRIVTGGDDGKVVVHRRDRRYRARSPPTPSAAGSTTWRSAPTGAVAWSAGKQAFVRSGKGTERMLEVPSTVGALAFAPKGFRLAIAHYNGASRSGSRTPRPSPRRLEWKGSHLAATVSPDGRFVVTAMQESTLHGWRLADRKDMRMRATACAYSSFDWSADGKWLATSGSTAAHPLAVPGQGRPDGQDPEDAGAGRRAGRDRRLPPQGPEWSRSAMPTAWC